MRTFRQKLAVLATLAALCAAPYATAAIITDTAINLADPPMLIINGSQLTGGTPTVTLGNFTNLTVVTQTATQVTALLPANTTLEGSYLVTISLTTGGGPRTPVQVGYDEAWVTVGATGPAGPQGPDGPVGPQGIEGPAGLQGPEGPQGVPGPIGPIGPQGPIGLTGSPGAMGPMGPMGPIGPQGPQGLPGAAGPIGPQGPQGATGPAGTTGQDGVFLSSTATGDVNSSETTLLTRTVTSTGHEVYLVTYQVSYSSSPILSYTINTRLYAGGTERGRLYQYGPYSGWQTASGATVFGPLSAGAHTIDLRTSGNGGQWYLPQMAVVTLKQ